MRIKLVFSMASLLAVSPLTTGCNPPGDGPLGPPLDGDGGASPSSDAGSMPPLSAMGLPCDVAAIFATRCVTCHANPPIVGAPMPLVTHEDFHAEARSDASRLVHELVKLRIHDAERPMPPTGALEPEELAALDAWLDAGAPAGTCEDAPPPVDPPPATGPDALPCDASHEFRAHAAGSTDRYHVPTDAGNLYECFTFRSPFDGTQQATAWAPIIDDARVVHHWILYRTKQPQPDGGVMACSMPADATFVAGWAPGGESFVMPDDVGLELPGPDDYLILQLHYWNVARHPDADDASGVAFCTTDTPRTHEAGIVTLGDAILSIPPRSAGHEETSTCPSWATRLVREPLHVLGAFPHMHEYGQALYTDILRGGDPTRIDPIVHLDHWDFQDQRFQRTDPEIVIQPGDAIRTTCVYDNPTDTTIRFGERTEDEMCLDFLMLYPIGAVGENRACGLI